MSTEKAQVTGTPRWFVYFVIAAMGVAFTMTLMTIAWNNAMERAERDFSLASQNMEDTVVRNIRIGHNSMNSLAAFLTANPEITRKQFGTIASSLLSEHSFIKDIAYCSGNPDTDKGGARGTSGGMQTGGFSLRFKAGARDKSPASCGDIIPAGDVVGTNRLLGEDDVWTMVMDKDSGGARNYWLLKRVDSDNEKQRV